MGNKLKVKLSDDKELVAEIRHLVKENGGYCPCALIKNEDTKCPCLNFRQSTKVGPCHCGMYEKVLKGDLKNE